MRILLVGDYPADPRLGSAKVYYKLREELAALGHDCDLLMSKPLNRDGEVGYLFSKRAAKERSA